MQLFPAKYTIVREGMPSKGRPFIVLILFSPTQAGKVKDFLCGSKKLTKSDHRQIWKSFEGVAWNCLNLVLTETDVNEFHKLFEILFLDFLDGTVFCWVLVQIRELFMHLDRKVMDFVIREEVDSFNLEILCIRNRVIVCFDGSVTVHEAPEINAVVFVRVN